MKIIISKDKNGKQITKYKPEDGLIFTVKDHCITYERRWMNPKYKKEAEYLLGFFVLISLQ